MSDTTSYRIDIETAEAKAALEKLQRATQGVDAALSKLGPGATASLTQIAPAAAKAGPAMDLAGGAARRLAAAGAPLGGILAKVGEGLGILSPEAAMAASKLGSVTSAGAATAQALTSVGVSLSSTLAVLGPIGIAVGVLALAWHSVSKEAERAEKASAAAVEANEKAAANLLNLSARRKIVAAEAQAAEGEITASALRGIKARAQAESDYAAEATRVNAQLAAAQTRLDEALGAGEAGRQTEAQIEEAQAAYTAYGYAQQAVARTSAELSEYARQLEVASQGTRRHAAAHREATVAVEEHAVALTQGLEAYRSLQPAQTALVALTQEEIDAYSAEAAAVYALADIRADTERNALEGEAAILAAGRERLAQIDALTAGYEQSASVMAEADLARVAVVRDTEAQIAEVRRSARAEEETAYTAQLQRQDAATLAAATSAISSWHAYTDMRLSQIDTETAAGRQQAQRQFRLSQSLAIAEIAINTASSIIKAYNELGYIGGTIVGVLLTAAGAGATATVLAQDAPSYHRGGMMAPDEAWYGAAKVTRREGVLSPAGVDGVGGADGVAALNRGSGLPPLSIPISISGEVVDRLTVEVGRRLGGARATWRSESGHWRPRG